MVEGYDSGETSLLDSLGYVKKHLNYQSIVNEVDSIKSTCYRLGYIETKLQSLSRQNDTTFKAKLHLKDKFHTIYIYYDTSVLSENTLEAISVQSNDRYFEVQFKDIEAVMVYLNAEIAKRGYPFTKLKLTDIEVDQGTLKARLKIDRDDQKRTIDTIVIKGYERFPASFIKHYLKIKPEQTFDLALLKNKTEKLNNLRFANQIKPPEILFTEDATAIYLYVEKSKSNAFDGFLGFGTNEDDGKLEFDGFLNLVLSNNLNYGESFRLFYKSDENDQKTFEAGIAMPYLFKTPLGFDMQLHLFKRDSSFTNANQSYKLHYQINPKHNIYAGYKTLTSNNLLSNSMASISDFDANYVSLGYNFIDLRMNDVLFPTDAMITIESDFGKRKTPNVSESQSKFLVDAMNLIRINKRNSIYARFNGGAIQSNQYLENELLRFGGINSIRGFEENSLYANLYGLINTEYRYRLSNTIFAHSIIDVAYFENDIIDTKEKLFGFGVGFGLLTNSGLFRFVYANGKSENQGFKLSNSKVHLSLTTSF
ncbi:hypothetical protein [Aestuariivivens sediminicola]|uniref:hypothetical protein n=1 Tax=Aestuariivivens sediminicola TaxID=2913560 RepID=UPI001F5709BE|nr:hypothetical protein [Aestuariivivens sediminicola]